jgi:hypothetical protein
MELTIPQPMAAELYYFVAVKIDQHNRSRQDNNEILLGTHDWSQRVNFSILGMQIPSIHGVAGKDSVFAKWARNGECIL